MGSLKSHFSFFPDWPLILHFKSKKPQTLKIFSLFSCTLDYSFSWDAFFLYNSSKTLVQMKNSTRSQNILMHADMHQNICVFCHLVVSMLLQWQIEYLQVLLWQQRVCWTPDVSQWSPVNVCHTDFVFNCHPETDLLECLVFFISTLKKTNNKRGFLGWIV